MSKFQEIYKYIRTRKRLINNIIKSENKVREYERQIDELQGQFINCTVNVDLYREFFKKYCIIIKDKYSIGIYKVNDIYLSEDYKGAPFYEVRYDYIESNIINKEDLCTINNTLSLRKFMHLLDYSNAKLEKIK